MEAGASGAAVVTRDGIPVVERLGATTFSDSVCAMAAASLAAAESAFSGSRHGAVRRAWIEGPGHVALLHTLDARLLVIVFMGPDADRQKILDAVQEAADGLRAAVR
jgi:predicted regulator of Ras-like GTPase activity (Roadblock/LC7/MglB family)